MKSGFWPQVIEIFHDFFDADTDNPRNDSPDDDSGEVDDPVGGEEGITDYYTYNLGEDFFQDEAPGD